VLAADYVWRSRGVNSRGFTLLELILAVAIAALVVGVSAPAMQSLYSSSQYRGAVQDVVGELALTRQQAIRSGESTEISFNPVENRVQRKQKIIDLPDELKMEVLAAKELNRGNVGVIRFYPDGGSSGGYIKLTHERGMSSQVSIDWLLGKIDVCQVDCVESF